MRATAPSGAAAIEGQVAWSGELGYGVRAPEADQATKDSMADPHPVVGQDGGVLDDHSAPPARRPRRRRGRPGSD